MPPSANVTHHNRLPSDQIPAPLVTLVQFFFLRLWISLSDLSGLVLLVNGDYGTLESVLSGALGTVYNSVLCVASIIEFGSPLCEMSDAIFGRGESRSPSLVQ